MDKVNNNKASSCIRIRKAGQSLWLEGITGLANNTATLSPLSWLFLGLVLILLIALLAGFAILFVKRPLFLVIFLVAGRFLYGVVQFPSWCLRHLPSFCRRGDANTNKEDGSSGDNAGDDATSLSLCDRIAKVFNSRMAAKQKRNSSSVRAVLPMHRSLSTPNASSMVDHGDDVTDDDSVHGRSVHSVTTTTGSNNGNNKTAAGAVGLISSASRPYMDNDPQDSSATSSTHTNPSLL